MAIVRAGFKPFVLDNVHISFLLPGIGTSAFAEDSDFTPMWQTVSDEFMIRWSGDKFISLWGEMTWNAGSGAVTGGTVQVIARQEDMGLTWGIEYMSLSATAVYNASTTASTSDDKALIRSALAGDDEFYLSEQADRAHGQGGSDQMYGRNGDDVLLGGGGWDRLYGGDGADSLYSGGGRDVLHGGKGRDHLFGGTDTGGDQFIFGSVQDSVAGAARDVIHNYTKGSDVITLSQIDARPGTAIDNAFAWGGTTATAYGVWWKAVEAGVMVRADVSGDAKADLEFLVKGVTLVWGSDFML